MSAHALLVFRWVGTAVGVVAFCLYSRSWASIARFVYDVPAAISAFSFLAWLLADGFTARWSAQWWSFGWLLVPLSVVPTGRAFLGWPVSGHLTDVLLVALVVSFRSDLPMAWRAACWVPVIIVSYLRWTSFDQGAHVQTYGAVAIASGCAAAALLARWLVEVGD